MHKLILTSLLILSGCASIETPLATAQPVPASRIYEPTLVSTSGANATFVRDSGFSSGWCTFVLSVGTVNVFAIRPGERIGLNLPTGTHVMKLSVLPGACPEMVQYLTSSFVAGDTQVFRVYTDEAMVRHFARIQ